MSLRFFRSRRTLRAATACVLLLLAATACSKGAREPSDAASVEAPAANPVTAPARAQAPVTRPAVPAETTPAAAPDPREAALAFFARHDAEGWHFPSRYHYNEWRHATGRRDRPHEITLGGKTARLSVGKESGIVILIDDLGNASWSLRRLKALGYPVNGAILPHTPLAKRAVEAIRANGGDPILHLPLEPLGFPGNDPGPGALFVTMPTETKARLFEGNWGHMPGLVGLNNHMGSRFTSDPASVAWLAGTLQGRRAFFVDSRTVAGSHAHATMIEHGVPSLGRTHFLDEKPTHEAVEASLREALAYARRNGFALAIGHPHRATMDVLEAAPALFREYGVKAVSLRKLFALDD